MSNSYTFRKRIFYIQCKTVLESSNNRSRFPICGTWSRQVSGLFIPSYGTDIGNDINIRKVAVHTSFPYWTKAIPPCRRPPVSTSPEVKAVSHLRRLSLVCLSNFLPLEQVLRIQPPCHVRKNLTLQSTEAAGQKGGWGVLHISSGVQLSSTHFKANKAESQDHFH